MSANGVSIEGGEESASGIRSLLIVLCLLLGWFAPARGSTAAGFQLSDLSCEYQASPMGVDTPQPRLGWQVRSPGQNQRQAAYQILVATNPELLRPGKADLWDSGRVESSESVHVAYAGGPLASRRQSFWKVRLWTDAGKVSDWSPIASWEMGMLNAADWKAQWIGDGPAREPRPVSGFFRSTNELSTLSSSGIPGAFAASVEVNGRSTLLRKILVAEKPVRQARVYVTGLGYYELTCNGRRVGNHVLAPAKSNYRKWVFYDTYDLAQQLRTGTNVLGLQLGNGWFNPYKKWWEPYRMQWFGSKRALLQLHLEYADGSSQVVVTDDTWQTAPGPVLSACVYDGEVYDATQERVGWDLPGTSDAGWVPATVVEPPGGRLVSQRMPAIKVVEQIRPVSRMNPTNGVYVFDLGQNFAGWVKLTAKGERGTRIRLRYAEDLLPNGNLDATSNERADATDVYVMKGEGTETYEPRFTFHGFRYVEVTGFPGQPDLSSVVGCVVHTDCHRARSFECSNELINRIHRATLWSQRSNLMGYPMDCPQRDERLGWFGDAMVTADEAMLNFDLPVFYQQWLEGVQFNQNETNGDISIVSPRPYMSDEPDPTWSSAYLVMAWQYYLHYGDRRFLAQHFDSMRRYVDYLGTQATNQIVPKYWIGDWGTTVEGWKEGEPVSVSTAFYYYDATILAKAAKVLGRQIEADHFAALADRIRAGYNRTFYNARNHNYDQGSQFSNAFPLYLGLAEERERQYVLDNVLADLRHHQGHFTVGVLGAKYLIEALTRYGRADVAYDLVNQTGYPSWAHMLEGGRTTLSEFWDLHGSHNHVMMGSIDAWFYKYLAGIQLDESRPGFQHIVIKPFTPDSLSFVRATVQTARGQVSVGWTRQNGSLRVKAEIPFNCTATIFIPAPAGSKVQTTPKLEMGSSDQTVQVYETGSGTSDFLVSPK